MQCKISQFRRNRDIPKSTSFYINQVNLSNKIKKSDAKMIQNRALYKSRKMHYNTLTFFNGKEVEKWLMRQNFRL